MHSPKKPKYQITSNLSEKQIEADVASFFGWCTPHEVDTPFRLLDVDEQVTGADKKFDRGSLIYIQFKKSGGLQSISDVAPSSRKGRSQLEDIRIYRNEVGLADSPSLFFQLRAKAKTAEDFQHNILLTYERPPFSRAIYVAPLLLDKEAYHRALHDSATRYLLDPFYYHLRYSISSKHWLSRFSSVPFLREHISIPPHERVAHNNHYYAYSETGTDISWHSPSLIDSGPSRLSDFMVSTFRNAISNPESMRPVEVLANFIKETTSSMSFRDQIAGRNESPLSIIGQHGRWLKENYDTRQFILLGNSEIINDMRSAI